MQENERLTLQLQKVQQDLDEARTGLDARTTERDERILELALVRQTVSALEGETADLSASCDAMLGQIEAAATAAKTYESTLEIRREENEALTLRLQDLQKQLEDAKRDLADRSAEIEERTEQLSATRDELAAVREELSVELEERAAQLAARRAELTAVREELTAELEERATQLTATRAELTAVREALSAELEERAAQLAAKRDELSAVKEELSAELEERAAQLAATRAELTAMQEELSAELQERAAQLAATRGELTAVQEELSAELEERAALLAASRDELTAVREALSAELEERAAQLAATRDELTAVREELLSRPTIAASTEHDEKQKQDLVVENELLQMQLKQAHEELELYFRKYRELNTADGRATVAVAAPVAPPPSEAAPAVVDLRGVIDGDGWYHAEHDGRWSGPTTESTLNLPPVEPGSFSLELDVVDAMSNDILEGMTVTLDGKPLKLVGNNLAAVRWPLFSRKKKRPKFPIRISAAVKVSGDGPHLLRINLPSTISPAAKGSNDTRQLGIRLRRATLVKSAD
jgi:chromosome segregation ATPase